MPTTTIQPLPYPSPTGVTPDVPRDIKALAEAVEDRTVMRFASLAARDAALPSGKLVDGMVCHVASDNGVYVRSAGAWRLLWRASTSAAVQRGTVIIAAGATSGSAAVVFPVPFGGNPSVTCTVTGTSVWAPWTSGRTASGVTINVTRLSGTGAASVAVDWIAAY